MKVDFGADDQNECTAAVLDYLRSIAELEVFDDSDKWPEVAQHVGRAVAEGDGGLRRGDVLDRHWNLDRR